MLFSEDHYNPTHLSEDISLGLYHLAEFGLRLLRTECTTLLNPDLRQGALVVLLTSILKCPQKLLIVEATSFGAKANPE